MSNQTQSTDVTLLQSAITNMDTLSQEGFSEIAAIARLTIKAIESGNCNNSMDDIIQALNVILSKANDAQNCINCEAENLGCSYISENTQRKINEVLEREQS